MTEQCDRCVGEAREIGDFLGHDSIGHRGANALAARGVYTVKKLLAMPDEEIADVINFGPACMARYERRREEDLKKSSEDDPMRLYKSLGGEVFEPVPMPMVGRYGPVAPDLRIPQTLSRYEVRRDALMAATKFAQGGGWNKDAFMRFLVPTFEAYLLEVAGLSDETPEPDQL